MHSFTEIYFKKLILAMKVRNFQRLLKMANRPLPFIGRYEYKYKSTRVKFCQYGLKNE